MQNVTETDHQEKRSPEQQTSDREEKNKKWEQPESKSFHPACDERYLSEEACLHAFKNVYHDILNMVLREQNIPYTCESSHSAGKYSENNFIHVHTLRDEAEIKGEIRGRQTGKEIGIRMGEQNGIKIGEYNKLKSLVLKKRLRGYTVETIADMLEENLDTIESITRELENQ